VSSKNEDNILYEDQHILMFFDINPDAKVHIQTIPKVHIKNISVLRPENLELLNIMKEKSYEYLQKYYSNEDIKNFM
jgi:diadenosine tetraphosphate (Ap4A) HIT family hydrolase